MDSPIVTIEERPSRAVIKETSKKTKVSKPRKNESKKVCLIFFERF